MLCFSKQTPCAHNPLKATYLAVACLVAFRVLGQDIQPPGHDPLPVDYHALVGARLIVSPSLTLTNATLVLKGERVLMAESNLLPPEGARVWDMKGKTLYPGFIDPYVLMATEGQAPKTTRTLFHDSASHQATGHWNFHGMTGDELDPGDKGPGGNYHTLRADYHVLDEWSLEADERRAWRELGFTAIHLSPSKGIWRGSGAVSLTGDTSPNRLVVRGQSMQHLALDASASSPDEYPRSLMGTLSLIRQSLLDTQHHMQSPHAEGFDSSMEALVPVLQGRKRVVIEPGSVLMAHRSHQIARDFDLKPIMVASGQEWRRPDLIKQLDAPWIVPVNFPQAPSLKEKADWDAVSLDLLRQWDWAPENPSLLVAMGKRVALSLHGLHDRKAFRKRVNQAIDRGLDRGAALAGLTTIPAELCQLSESMGTLSPGKLANLIVVEGDYFDPEARIEATWVLGRRYAHDHADATKEQAKGEDQNTVEMEEPTAEDMKPLAPSENPTQDKTHRRLARSPLQDRPSSQGPDTLLIRHATIWTCGPQGILQDADILIQHGHILEVGQSLTLPPDDLGSCVIIDAQGKHLTPGLIDAHSHSMIMGGVNEGTMPSTAMVRVSDVVNSETDNLYYQLAGGLTTANLLHGSANPIGGQNAVIKLRWGAGPDAMIFAEAPAGIKFALGENVKQSNWGEARTTRFPQSRMGVPVFYENRFTAALAYQQTWQAFHDGSNPKRPRIDLELEALVEILEGERLIHCHSYRQDEILVFLRVMEQFGIQVGTLQHVLEGYKVADEIAAHGAGASCFSDWWAYKFEVLDAIPYAGSLMHQRGALVSFNSDDSDLARRLYLEAAKAVKYGDTPPEEALCFVTLYPAQQLRIDRWVGSLEAGKHADFVLWSGSPLDTSTICLETWIEGVRYFDRHEDRDRTLAKAREKAALVAKAQGKGSATSYGPNKDEHDASSFDLFFLPALEKQDEGRILHCDD